MTNVTNRFFSCWIRNCIDPHAACATRVTPHVLAREPKSDQVYQQLTYWEAVCKGPNSRETASKRTPGRPREASQRPREAGPPREASERLREANKGPEKPREAERVPERPSVDRTSLSCAWPAGWVAGWLAGWLERGAETETPGEAQRV